MCFIISDIRVKVCLQPLSDKTVRVSVLPAGERVTDVFATLDLRDGCWPEPTVVADGSGGDAFLVGGYTVTVTPDPLAIRLVRRGRE